MLRKMQDVYTADWFYASPESHPRDRCTDNIFLLKDQKCIAPDRQLMGCSKQRDNVLLLFEMSPLNLGWTELIHWLN